MVFSGRAAERLPFDSDQICRLSVDNIPRSIAIRQGADVWLGFDLENALVFKAWRAAKGKPGLILKGFKAESAGDTLFDRETTGDGWQMKRDGKSIPLSVRYLGCIQNAGHFELRWELSHPDGAATLSERIAMTPVLDSSQVTRELRFDPLEKGASIALPAGYGKNWILTGPDGDAVKTFTGSAWHQLSLR